jgi:hypothetical protein
MADGVEEGNAVAPRGPARRRGTVRASLDADEFIALMHGSDPVRVELTRLENELRDKERELGEAQTEIRALRLSERAREKAVEEVIAVSFVLDFVVQRYAFPVYLFVFPEMAISFALR